MKPGDIIVYRERGMTLDQDRVRRATLQETRGRLLYCTRGLKQKYLHVNDVLRVEPSQHGWTGTP